MMSHSRALEMALTSYSMPSLLLDEKGVIRFMNQAVLELLGEGMTTAMQGPWLQLLRPNERLRAEPSAPPQAGVWELSDEAGNGIPCEFTVLPYGVGGGGERSAALESGDGDVRWLVFFQDARVSGEVAETLRSHEASFRQTIGSVPGALFQYELFPDGAELMHYVSPGCFELWELEAEEVELNVGLLWAMVYEDDVVAMKASVMKSADELSPWLHEWRIITPSGKHKWVQGSALPTRRLGGGTLWHSYLLDVTERKLQEESHTALLQRSSEQLHSLAAQLQTAREEERKDLARELHDEVGQYLAVISLDLHEVNRCHAAGDSITAPAAHLDSMLQETLMVVQGLAERLRPPMFDYRGLASLIASHVEQRFEAEGGVKFLVEVEDGEQLARELEPDTALAMYRVFQESSTNVLRHSGAAHAWIRLRVEDSSTLVLEVEDDGIGITEEQIQHPLSLGLTGMQERMRAIGGTFSVGIGACGGVLTRATLNVPTVTP